MKIITTAIIAISVLLSSQAFAYECAKRSAYVRATIVAKKTDSLTYCKAELQFHDFLPATLCPLVPEDSEVRQGVNFPLTNGHDCEIAVGQEVSGELIVEGRNVYITD